MYNYENISLNLILICKGVAFVPKVISTVAALSVSADLFVDAYVTIPLLSVTYSIPRSQQRFAAEKQCILQ